MASTTDAPSSQVATLYGHCNFDFRWSEFETFQDEADELEARMVSMAIVHRLTGVQGSWYVCSGFLLALLGSCLTVPLPFYLVLESCTEAVCQKGSTVKHFLSYGNAKLWTMLLLWPPNTEARHPTDTAKGPLSVSK